MGKEQGMTIKGTTDMKLKLATAVILSCMVAACSDPKSARKALADAGYTNIETTGYSFFSCGKDDTFSTGFKATSPAGRPVEGAVCSAWMKGSTIRTW